eukprot:TRINITY_DN103614_c0_g1_i1.p1 TRINITY_DN103614_c0_g1~~TRINITY_DN103614_c0_g1_i1.p1  ORF type:complete len:629 (+),score=83.81 TRINITY_DN103614_c0_g1_i1:86-1972(+)
MGENAGDKSLLHGYNQGATPMTTKRSCTDVCCVLAFFASLAGFIALYKVGVSSGQLNPVSSLKDYGGNTCGTDGRGQFIYFCVTSRTSKYLDLSKQVCVDRCPTDSSDDIGTVCSDQASLKNIAYGTTPLFNVMCFPNGSPFVDQVQGMFGNNVVAEETMKVLAAASHKEMMIVAILASTLLCFVYIGLLRCFARLLVTILLVGMALVPAALSIALFVSASGTSNQDLEALQLTNAKLSLGDAQTDTAIAIVMALVSLIAVFILCCKRSAIEQAVDAVEEASSCILGMPGLIFEPWLAFVCQLAVFLPGVMFFFALMLLSNGSRDIDFTDPSSLLSLDNVQVLVLIYYVILFLWVMELMRAISQFVVIYVAEVWYFNVRGSKNGILSCFKHCSCTEMLKGYCDAVTYHLGSLIYGSLLLTFTRIVRWIAQIVSEAAKDSGNQVVRLLCCCFLCCVSCLEWVLQFTSKFAYMDIAMNSTNYCTGATHAAELILSSGAGLATLEGTLWIFSFVGAGGSGTASAAIAWLLATSVPPFNDASNPAHIADVKSTAIAAGIVGCLVAIPFMHVFDTVADTMFYCDSVEHKRAASAGDDEEGQAGGACWHCLGASGAKSAARAQELRGLLRTSGK